MTDKSGGDVNQANVGSQGSLSDQDVNSVAAAGAGIVDGMGGDAASLGAAQQAVQQAQQQGNIGAGGDGGDDNISADTTISIS